MADEKEYDCLQFYGYKITTDKGDATIEFRNSSNGYYGGSIGIAGDHTYGNRQDGFMGAAQNVTNWKPITDDWSA